LVDVFDAGPCLEAVTKRIHVVQHQIKCTVKIVKALAMPSSGYLSNCSLANYRCCYGDFMYSNGQAEITQETAKILKVNSGDAISIFS
jgi:arginine/ornithine N-succinyltransferase beta subunit